MIRARRSELSDLRAERAYPAEVLRRLELDLEEARLPRRRHG